MQGLTSNIDEDIWSQILAKLEQDPDIMLQKVTEECWRTVNLKHDNTRIKEKDTSKVHAVCPKV